jgi:hypothetical protein
MLVRALSAAISGIEAFPVEVELNSGWGDTVIVMIGSISPIRPSLEGSYSCSIKNLFTNCLRWSSL